MIFDRMSVIMAIYENPALFALISIVGTSLVWVVSMVLTELSDPGPLFYFANRVGKDNRVFKMYKFRSMRVLKAPKQGAEASLRPDEDRIFPFGHFIRKVKIDELPQLLNILNGTMSVIGPVRLPWTRFL